MRARDAGKAATRRDTAARLGANAANTVLDAGDYAATELMEKVAAPAALATAALSGAAATTAVRSAGRLAQLAGAVGPAVRNASSCSRRSSTRSPQRALASLPTRGSAARAGDPAHASGGPRRGEPAQEARLRGGGPGAAQRKLSS